MTKFLALFLGLFVPAHAQVFVTVDGMQYPARAIDKAAVATVTGTLIFGGLGDTPDQAWSGKVVLLDRGTITFSAKVKAVKDAGGLAVIVANNEAGAANRGTLEPDSSTIPAVSVSQADGAAIKAKAGSIVRVGAPLPPPPPIVLPDPRTMPGGLLASDGEKYILTKPPGPAMSNELKVGETLTLSVAANGTPPFSYQWIKDGQNISGATSATFVVQSVKLTDAGGYVCQITNASGTAPSQLHNISVK